MAFLDYITLVRVVFSFIPFFAQVLSRRALAYVHKRSYVPSESPRNVVIVGGSFAGLFISKNLCQSLPSGWRVILIERNSHMNFTFAFPRFSVASGHEDKAFIPYNDDVTKGNLAPEGIFKHIRGTVTELTDKAVILASGEEVPYEYLVMATGASQPFPARMQSQEKSDACAELQSMQQNIKDAAKIAVIGGGAVGIEIATDIQTFYTDKQVTLVQSRDRLLPEYRKRLHDHVLAVLKKQGMKVVLSQRAEITATAEKAKKTTLSFTDGHLEDFDLVISCTGQKPNSELLEDIAPESISNKTKGILVKPTLQISDPRHPNIYAIGDVAETGAPRMARSGNIQSFVISDNINLMIAGKPPTAKYETNMALEGALKLWLGKNESVIYIEHGSGDALLPGKGIGEDFDIAHAWSIMGTKLPDQKAGQ